MKKWFKIVSSLFLLFIGTYTSIAVYFTIDYINNPYVTNDEDYYLIERLQNGIGYIQDGKIEVITFDLSLDNFHGMEIDDYFVNGILPIHDEYIDILITIDETNLVYDHKITTIDEAKINNNKYGYCTIEGSNKNNSEIEPGETVRFYLALNDVEESDDMAIIIIINKYFNKILEKNWLEFILLPD